MASTTVSPNKWNKISNITDDDLSGSLTLKGGTMLLETHITLVNNASTDDAATQPFDFNVSGDLSIVINSGSKNTTNTDGANNLFKVQGSVDGTNYVDLETGSSNKVIDTDPFVHVYDYDANGRMPYMRVNVRAHGNSTDTIKIAVIPH